MFAPMANRLSVLACLVIAITVSACTTTKIETMAVEPAKERHAAVAVGTIDTANPVWEHRLPYIREGMVRKFQESGEFATVLNSVETPLPESVAIVNGTLTELDEGSTAARFIIGFGAGRAKVGGRFQIAAADGTVLAEFTEREAYAGGAGIGGIDMLSIDQMMGRMGEEVAEAVIRWNRGEPLKKPEAE